MWRWRCTRWLLTLVLLLPSGVPAGAAPPRPAMSTPTPAPAAAPLWLVENAGQFAPGARFQAGLGEATLWLAEDALWLTVLRAPCAAPGTACHVPRARCAVPGATCAETTAAADPPAVGVHLKLVFEGANRHPVLVAEGRRATRVNYLRGSDPAGWRQNVPVWSAVRYQALYPGIDLVIRGGAAGWQPVLEAGAGADLSAVRLRVEGAAALALAVDGEAVQVQTAAGAYRLPLLLVRGAAPGASPVVAGTLVRMPFAARGAPAPPPARIVPLTGTQDLVYSTFLGGSGQEGYAALAVDRLGASYVTGETSSQDFPTTPGAFDPTWNGRYRDAVVAKLSPNGAELLYATYLGGTYEDFGYDIAVDASGAAYVVGVSMSADFPFTPGAFNTTLESYDVFVTQLAPDGASLVYSTFVGSGCYPEQSHQCGLALDSAGHAFVVGNTWSPTFPVTPGAFQTNCACDEHSQGFVTKLNPTGTGLVYSTYLGGGGTDWAGRVVVDAAGAAYVSGLTASYDFPTTPGAFDTTYNGGELDAFVTKLAPDGSALVYSTYLGGSLAECAYQDCVVAIDATGAAYVTGNTQSSDFPITPGAFDPVFQGGAWPYNLDAFVTKLTPDGGALVYATFLGGGEWDGATGMRADLAGRAFVAGLTWSADFPTTPDGYDPLYHFSNAAAFVSVLNATGTELDYSTYLGGSDLTYAWDMALDAAGAVQVVGVTLATDFPTTPGAFRRTNSGGWDFFVAKLAPHMRVQVLLPLVRLDE